MDNVSRSDVTRRKLVDSAIEILAERGYRGLTFVEVCRRAELSRGAIHHHYDGVTDLLIDVVQKVGDRIVETTTDLPSQPMPASELFAACIDFVWAQLHTTELRALAQIRAAIPTSADLQGEVLAKVRDVHQMLYDQIESITREGSSRANPAVARIVVSALSGAAQLDAAINPPAQDPEREDFRRALKELVLR